MFSSAVTRVVNISIHALRVEGDGLYGMLYMSNSISIHALRVEGDAMLNQSFNFICKFLSTPSGWRATKTAFENEYNM